MSEKRKPTYDLASIRSWATSDRFRATATALRGALDLGFTAEEMVVVIASLRREHFYKSMTSFADYRIWQDVYHAPSDIGTLYVKLQQDIVTEFVLLSFKEKDHG